MLDAAVAVGEMRGQAARAGVGERAVELVGEQPLRALAPSAAGQREGGAAERLAGACERVGQVGLGDAGLGADLGAGPSDEVDEGERPARGVVEPGKRALDVRERMGRVDGPGRALGDGSEAGAFHRGRGYP